MNNNDGKPKSCDAIKDHLTSVSNFSKNCLKSPMDDFSSLKDTSSKCSQVFTCFCNLSTDRLIQLQALKPIPSKCLLCNFYLKSNHSFITKNDTNSINSCFSKCNTGKVPFNSSHSNKELCKKVSVSISKIQSILEKFENLPMESERNNTRICDCPKLSVCCSKSQTPAVESEKNCQNNTNINDLVDELVRTTKRVKKIAEQLVGEGKDLNAISDIFCTIQKDHCQLLSLVAPKADVCQLFEDSKYSWENRSKSEESVFNSFAKACSEKLVDKDRRDPTAEPLVISKKKKLTTKKNKTKNFTVLSSVTDNPVVIREDHKAKLIFEPSCSFTDDEEIESKILDGWDIESSACALKKQNCDNFYSELKHSADNLQTNFKKSEASSSNHLIGTNTNKKNKSNVIPNVKSHINPNVDKKLANKYNRMPAAGSNFENDFSRNSRNVFLHKNSEIIQSQRNENLQKDTNFKIGQHKCVMTRSLPYDNLTNGIILHNKVHVVIDIRFSFFNINQLFF